MSRWIIRCGLAMVVALVSWTGGGSVEIPEATASKCALYEEQTGCDFDLLCHCDSLCSLYDDCCTAPPAAAAGNASQPDSAPNGGPGPHEVCVGFPAGLISSTTEYSRGDYQLPTGLWLIGRCPPTWADDRGRQLCEAPGDESALSDDPLLSLPVASASGDTYRNVYCAVCHGVPLKTVKSWQVVYLVNATVYRTPAKSLASFAGLGRPGVGVRFKRRETAASPPRRCLAGVVSSCPAGYGDDAVARLCRSRMVAAVQPRTGTIYRNWHCALCHGDLDPPRLAICRPLFLYPQRFATTSLTALVDFRSGGATTRLLMANASRRLDEAVCSGPGEFRDPFSLRCRRLCPEDYRLKRGVCSPAARGPKERTGKGSGRQLHSSVVDRVGGGCDGNQDRSWLLVWLCLAADSADPCSVWEEILATQPSAAATAVLAQGRCQEEEHGLAATEDGAAGCGETTAVVRVDLPAEAAPRPALESALAGLFPAAVPAGCPTSTCNGTVRRAVLSRGCLPVDAQTHPACHDLLTENERSVRLGSWNGTGALYVRDTNALYPLSRAAYRTEYQPRSGGVNATYVLTHCGDSIDHFNCSFMAVNSTQNRSLADYVTLESGGALVCRPRVDIASLDDDDHSEDFGYTVVTCVAIALSMLALTASFVTYAVFPGLRNLAGRCVMSLIVAVFVGQLMIAVTGDGVARAVGPAVCSLLAALLHYSVLAGFTWTNALAFYLARTLGPGAKPSAASRGRHSFLRYSLFGWGVPLAALAVCLLAGLPAGRPYGRFVSPSGAWSCTFPDRHAYVVAFVVPVAGSILANAGLFVVILAGFSLRRRPTTGLHAGRKARCVHLRRDALITTKVGFLLAFTWIFGFLSGALQSSALLYIFCFLTSLQGVYIFLAFTFTQQVRALWRQHLGLDGSGREGAGAGHEGKTKGALQRREQSLPSTADKRNLCRQSTPSGQPSPPLPHPVVKAPAEEPEPV